MHILGIFQVLPYRTGGVLTGLWMTFVIEPNGTTGPLNGSPNRRS